MRQSILIFVITILSVLTGNELVQAQETAAPLFVREDCVWEYEYIYTKPPFGADKTYELHKYKFEGTEEIEGKVYHKLKDYHISRWDVKWEDLISLNEEDCDITVGLLREENGKVWMRNQSDYIRTQISGTYKFDWELKFEKDYDVEEFVIFDFTVGKGDKILSWTYNPFPIFDNPEYDEPGYYLTGYEIKDIEIRDGINIYSAEYCYYPVAGKFENYQYAEGVGTIDIGTILGPEIVIYCYADATWYEWSFNNQYDLDGNVIIAGKGTIAGVSAVEADLARDTRMYDVTGREIRNPQPGTIYIQNGRKFIAR